MVSFHLTGCREDSLASWCSRYLPFESRPTSASSSTSSFKYSKPEALLTEEYQRTTGGLNFVVEPCPYQHRHFKLAASIFDVMKHSVKWNDCPMFHPPSETEFGPDLTTPSPPTIENDDDNDGLDDDDDDDDDRFQSKSEELSEIRFESKTEKRIVYHLAFQTLKCE